MSAHNTKGALFPASEHIGSRPINKRRDGMIDDAELDRRFKFHKSTEEQLQRHEMVRNLALSYARNLIQLCPQSELSLALTHLEDAVMCANAAIARN